MHDLNIEAIQSVLNDHGIDDNTGSIAKDILEAINMNQEYASYSVNGGRGHSEPSVESKLRAELAREKSKSICPECKGRGSTRYSGPCHYSDITCFRCSGVGWVYN